MVKDATQQTSTSGKLCARYFTSFKRAKGCLRLQILEEAIKYRWGALPEEQRQGIRNYISNLIIKISSSEASFRSEKVFLNKLNIILVQVSQCRK